MPAEGVDDWGDIGRDKYARVDPDYGTSAPLSPALFDVWRLFGAQALGGDVNEHVIEWYRRIAISAQISV